MFSCKRVLFFACPCMSRAIIRTYKQNSKFKILKTLNIHDKTTMPLTSLERRAHKAYAHTTIDASDVYKRLRQQ